MFINPAKYLGCTVEIIYMDRHGKLSQRRVKLQAIKGELVHAYCYQRNAPRIFTADNILAVERKREHAV